tara:strand:- start:89 stop:295 length:207 start_codon:yes stop_codon:yes gene_type:complete
MDDHYMKAFPAVPKDLLDRLEEQFPSIDFSETDNITKLNFHYGQRSVINFLKHQYDLQNDNILNRKQL